VAISLAVELPVEREDMQPLAILQVININDSGITFGNIDGATVAGDGEPHIYAGGFHLSVLQWIAARNLLHSGGVASQSVDDG